ncbi:MAG: hypothetical protein IPH13_01880 [Planctomycetes bacterium]|nr:hypothetical protein [Planctomycetota bacterium]MCC7172750.1 hypothetical protein [Planctomycetota bacterium]
MLEGRTLGTNCTGSAPTNGPIDVASTTAFAIFTGNVCTTDGTSTTPEISN